MTEEEKKITKRLKDDIALVTFNDNLNYGIGNLYVNINDLKIILNLISKQQTDIEMKDKVIDYAMEEIHSIVNLGEFIDRNIDNLDTKEEIKQYFYKTIRK